MKPENIIRVRLNMARQLASETKEAIEKLEKQLVATRERLELTFLWHETFAQALEWALDDGTIKEG